MRSAAGAGHRARCRRVPTRDTARCPTSAGTCPQRQRGRAAAGRAFRRRDRRRMPRAIRRRASDGPSPRPCRASPCGPAAESVWPFRRRSLRECPSRRDRVSSYRSLQFTRPRDAGRCAPGGSSVAQSAVMKLFIFVAAALCTSCSSQAAADKDLATLEKQAQNITIIRDNWGIPHVYGKTDADAVFGVVYAQAEDDFNRVETNFINSQGRLAEAEGESEIYRDLRMKLFIDPADMKAQYDKSPAWLKTLMNAWADGLNYYLHTHPNVKPRVIKRFEPWMALTFTEGSIGGDIEKVNLTQLEAFYGQGPKKETSSASLVARPPSLSRNANELRRDELASGELAYVEPTGSNGAAVAPSNTSGHHSLLLINPHTSFFFRAEAQMVSEEGLTAYGALTWGQFFIYQGFNDRAGWMHTSSGVDNIDESLESVTKKGDGF